MPNLWAARGDAQWQAMLYLRLAGALRLTPPFAAFSACYNANRAPRSFDWMRWESGYGHSCPPPCTSEVIRTGRVK